VGKTPAGPELADLQPLLPVFLSYVLSFTYVGIYWNNHHHLLHTVKRVGGGILWANLHLLFRLSLLPFATAWTGESWGNAAPIPKAIYGCVLMMAGIAYYTAIPLAFVHPWISNGIYACVALIWIVPDRRIERVLSGRVE
jgi:uncharacterized membrane protein